jgi:hypothetical protein
MNAEKARQYGALAGMLFTIAAWGCNWLITPISHPTASSARQTAVVVQVLITAGLAAWCWRIAGQAARAEPPRSTATRT